MNFRSCVSVAVALIASVCLAPPQVSSRTSDAKYGFSIIGPKGWKKETSQTDGYVNFASPDEKAHLTLTGEWQTKRILAKTAAAEFLKGRARVRQTQTTTAGFSVSWVEENLVWFRREEFGNRVMSRLEFNFPAGEEVKYGAILKEALRTYIPAQDAEVPERMRAFASVRSLEQLLVMTGNEISWDSCEELILVGKPIIKPLAEMLSKSKSYLAQEATGSFPGNALYILARIDSTEASRVLKQQGDAVGLQAWNLRHTSGNSKLGVLGRDWDCFSKPNGEGKPAKRLPAGTVLEFMDKVVNPALEGPRGGPAIFDKVKLKNSGEVVYLQRPGAGAVRLSR